MRFLGSVGFMGFMSSMSHVGYMGHMRYMGHIGCGDLLVQVEREKDYPLRNTTVKFPQKTRNQIDRAAGEASLKKRELSCVLFPVA